MTCRPTKHFRSAMASRIIASGGSYLDAMDSVLQFVLLSLDSLRSGTLGRGFTSWNSFEFMELPRKEEKLDLALNFEQASTRWHACVYVSITCNHMYIYIYMHICM